MNTAPTPASTPAAHPTLGLTVQQHAALVDAAKAHALTLRREAIDAAIDASLRAARACLRRALRALWPQNRTRPAGTRRVTSVAAAGVQNRPQGPLRLLEPRCSPSSLN